MIYLTLLSSFLILTSFYLLTVAVVLDHTQWHTCYEC